MAKDLPYFKFIISEWNDGDITLCSMEAQGLFINLCSVYWSGGCALSIAKAKRRFSDCSATAWKQLISEGILKVSGDDIKINFLDEQLKERELLSKKNSQNASERYKKPATAVPPHTSGIELASNIEEKREEESRVEERRIDKIGEGPVCVSINSKYLNVNPLQIYDLLKYFQWTGQYEQIKNAGWASKFSEFLNANPARVFDDEDHLYNSFKKFCLEPTINGKKSFKPSFEL